MVTMRVMVTVVVVMTEVVVVMVGRLNVLGPFSRLPLMYSIIHYLVYTILYLRGKHRNGQW